MDILDQLSANNMKNEELVMVYGGAGLSAAVINAIIRGVTFSLEVGRYIGSAIRRITKKKYC